jgi:hypothetical protein
MAPLTFSFALAPDDGHLLAKEGGTTHTGEMPRNTADARIVTVTGTAELDFWTEVPRQANKTEC